MTKREKKYQHRLFAEWHLRKKQQLSLTKNRDKTWYELYREYRFFAATGLMVPSWMAGIAISKMLDRMSDCNTSIKKLSQEAGHTTKALSEFAYSASRITGENP